jgi:glucokinase-like ROK family protein
LARIALEAGAWSVVVGSAITRPGSITATFVEAIRPLSEPTSKTARYVIGIDIGGTAIKSAVVAEDGTVQLPQQVPTQASQGRETIAASLSTALTHTLKAAAQANLEIAGIGVASAGAIHSANGTVFAATENLPGWAGFHLRQYLQGFTELPIFVENDAQAAALAELRFGAAKGLSSFVALTIGTGIGGGIVIDGRLVRGTHGFAGTLGHQTIRFDGKPCNCGRRGCLEAYVSTAALIEEYRQLEPAAPIDQPAATAARLIADRSIAGDPKARRAYSQLAGYLAEGVANICNLLDPEAIILSGGLIEGQPDFLHEVEQRSAALLHFGAKRPPRLIASAAGLYSGVQGAAATVFDQLKT